MALLVESSHASAHLFVSQPAFSLNSTECHSEASAALRPSGSAPSCSRNIHITQDTPMSADPDSAYLIPFLLNAELVNKCTTVAPMQWSAEDLLKQFNMVRITENTTNSSSTATPVSSSQSSSYNHLSPRTKRKRVISSGSSLRKSSTTNQPSAPTPTPPAQQQQQQLPQKKIKTMTVAAKQDIFAKWLELKACGISDFVFEQSAIACAIGPQDLYQHFLEFEPLDPSAFDRQLRYERQSAENALHIADVGAWLLRRSSYNRRFSGRLILTSPPLSQQQPHNHHSRNNSSTLPEQQQEERELNLSGTQCMPQFYAFSYNKQPESNTAAESCTASPFRIAHLLLVHVQWHGWALADTVGNAVKCHRFFDSFLGLLGFIMDNVDAIAPTRRVGYEYEPGSCLME
eukprot:TRINITY_DN2220_c0_g1_i1.p1 TRINITY_DN2220_c0_g1~~TRINITY_DN2220_c0_g1_i1.p1  ORF type:complete len:402 (-),score=78.62 TRINITY_DN2220_c0_g1_i1:121-1326(-)